MNGGRRPGAGRKKLPYKVKQVKFYVHESYVDKVKELVKQYLKGVSESLPDQKASESLLENRSESLPENTQ